MTKIGKINYYNVRELNDFKFHTSDHNIEIFIEEYP